MKVYKEGTEEVLYEVLQIIDDHDPKLCCIICNTASGTLISTTRYRKGLIHSIGAPAYEEFDEEGDLVMRVFYEKGLEHKLSGPSLEVWEKGIMVHSSQKIWGVDANDSSIQKHIEEIIGI